MSAPVWQKKLQENIASAHSVHANPGRSIHFRNQTWIDLGTAICGKTRVHEIMHSAERRELNSSPFVMFNSKSAGNAFMICAPTSLATRGVGLARTGKMWTKNCLESVIATRQPHVHREIATGQVTTAKRSRRTCIKRPVHQLSATHIRATCIRLH